MAPIRLAATLADGWVHPSDGIPETLLLFSAAVKYLALEAERDPNALELEKVIYLAIDDDKAQARRRLAILQQFYGRGYIVYNCCAYGPPADCAALYVINRPSSHPASADAIVRSSGLSAR